MAEITKIVVKIGDIEVSLTQEQARDLQRTLNDLFGRSWYPYLPLTYPTYPTVVPSVWSTLTSGATAVITAASSE